MLQGAGSPLLSFFLFETFVYKYAQGFQGSVMCLANAYVVIMY